MARNTTVEVTCDKCGKPKPFFYMKVFYDDDHDGGPVTASIDLCTPCAKDLLSEIKDRKLIHDRRLQ